jgi:hypothetical protein
VRKVFQLGVVVVVVVAYGVLSLLLLLLLLLLVVWWCVAFSTNRIVEGTWAIWVW